MTATIRISDLDSSLEGNWLEVICPDFRYVQRLHPKIFQLGWIFAVDQMVVVHKQIIPPNRFPTICYVMAIGFALTLEVSTITNPLKRSGCCKTAKVATVPPKDSPPRMHCLIFSLSLLAKENCSDVKSPKIKKRSKDDEHVI
jgi:hypothetical protein